MTFISRFAIFLLPYSFLYSYEKGAAISKPKTGQTNVPSPQAMGNQAKEKGPQTNGSMRMGKVIVLFSILLLILSCSSKPKTSILTRDLVDPPGVVQEAFAREGKSDYFLLLDEGYSFRLIYLCENRVFNFVEEPANNPVLVSIQPILDTSVEKRLSADDRRRIWACMERRVWEEQSRIEEIKSRVFRDRIQLEKEIKQIRAEQDQILAAMAEKQRLDAERQRRLEEERRRAEEERHRKIAEEQRRLAEEDRKVKIYKAGEREELLTSPSPPVKATETGIFLVMREARINENPRDNSKTISKASKYDIFDVIHSNKDNNGNQWYQVVLGERRVSEKGKRFGWSPEERAFWVKNKLQVWVYPGEFVNIGNVRPLKIRVEDAQFTGRMAMTQNKLPVFEVSYTINTTSKEAILGWVEENDGIRRSLKTKEEMRNLLNDLSRSLWPLRVQEDVLRGYIRQGFTREQVVLSWGRPDHVNTTRTLVGVHEQWVYGEPPFPKAYVYFENGLVKSWELFKNTGK